MCSKFCIFLSVVCLSLRFSLADHSFVEIDPELRRQQRNLLENNEEATEGTVSDNEPKENKKKGKFEPGEYLLGTKRYHIIVSMSLFYASRTQGMKSYFNFDFNSS